MSKPTGKVVQAAGGVVWRATSADVEIVVVHRPKYDDWSLPKGKLESGETWEDAAIREVFEETGQKAELGPFLHEVEYVDQKSNRGGRDRLKIVRYWAMQAMGGTFEPHGEVDTIRWIRPEDAISLLTHELDHQTVQRFSALGIGRPASR